MRRLAHLGSVALMCGSPNDAHSLGLADGVAYVGREPPPRQAAFSVAATGTAARSAATAGAAHHLVGQLGHALTVDRDRAAGEGSGAVERISDKWVAVRW